MPGSRCRRSFHNTVSGSTGSNYPNYIGVNFVILLWAVRVLYTFLLYSVKNKSYGFLYYQFSWNISDW